MSEKSLSSSGVLKPWSNAIFTIADIDILEDSLRCRGNLLDMLLFDHTTRRNILWGTDSYITRGKRFSPKDHMKPELVTGVYGKLIQPRAVKSRAEQLHRTKDKAEVFTPLRIVREINSLVDQTGGANISPGHTWQNYVAELHLEIACGEAPFIVSRYNPVAHGKLIKLGNRVGFLDHKLRVVSHFCHKPKEWLEWAKVAFQSSYGYEWQGDNILIARENLLYTLTDYYRASFGYPPTLKTLETFARIISWNIFQMDGARFVIPMSCRHETRITIGENTLFGETPDTVEKYECEGCKFNRPIRHNGTYVKVMDWAAGQSIDFASLINQA